jgi:hypothetical protein
MHFGTKNTLKNNRNHTPKQALKPYIITFNCPCIIISYGDILGASFYLELKYCFLYNI